MRAIVLATLALVALAHQTSQVEFGRYRGTLTTSAPRQLGGRVFYTRCGDGLGISFSDTLSPGLSMTFMTRVSTLRLGRYRARPLNFHTPVLPSPTDTNLSGFFNLFIRRDTAFFADSGSLHLTRIAGNELEGRFYYHASALGASPGVTIRGAFRARDKSEQCP